MRILNNLSGHILKIQRIHFPYLSFKNLSFFVDLHRISTTIPENSPFLVSLTMPHNFHFDSILEMDDPIDLVGVDPIKKLTKFMHILIFL